MRPGLQRPAVGAGVDAEGEAADDDEPGRRQVAAELAGDVAAVGAGAAGPDHRHRPRPVGELAQQGRIAAADQRPGRVGRVAQALGVERVVAAAAPAAGRRQARRQAALGERLDRLQELATRPAAPTAATRSSLESRSSSGEREPGDPVATLSM